MADAVPSVAQRLVDPRTGSITVPWAQFLSGLARGQGGDISDSTVIVTGTSTARTVANLFADFVSVKDFGAFGNGVTDDTAAIQAALDSGYKRIYFPAGSYVVSAQLNAPAGVYLFGEQQNAVILQRTATHTGHTLAVGSSISNAISFNICNITFNRSITFNGGSSYTPGTSTTIDNRLTGGQAHIQVWQPQNAIINDCRLVDMPYGIDIRGGSLMTIRDCVISGSIWDYQTAGLQEGIAAINLSGGGVCTLFTIDNCYLGGGYASAVRNVTIGSVVATYAEDVGSKFGIQMSGVEGIVINGCYIGGQDTHSIFVNPANGVTCTNLKITNNFFDGARFYSIYFGASTSGGAAVLFNIAGNHFNGELKTTSHIFVDVVFPVPCAFQGTICSNTMLGTNQTAITLLGAIGVKVSDNAISSYHFYGGFTGNAAGSGGIYILLGASNCDKVFTSGNIWGGAVNNLSGVNNCQWGAFFDGAAPTSAGASGERSAGLGLAGGALVNIAQTYPV